MNSETSKKLNPDTSPAESLAADMQAFAHIMDCETEALRRAEFSKAESYHQDKAELAGRIREQIRALTGEHDPSDADLTLQDLPDPDRRRLSQLQDKLHQSMEKNGHMLVRMQGAVHRLSRRIAESAQDAALKLEGGSSAQAYTAQGQLSNRHASPAVAVNERA